MRGKSCFPCRQSILQCPHCPHRGQGFVGGRELGHDFAQYPFFPHQKQASEGCLPGTLGSVGCVVLVLEDGDQHLISCAGIFVP
jgi:hypothetical protein